MTKPRVTIVVPTLNEIEGVRVTMPKILPEWGHQILFVDGGSTDGTIEYAREHGYQIHVQSKPGIRQAYGEILHLIEGEIIITFMPDGNSIPELIPALVEKMDEGYDMVIASRYLPPAKSDDDDAVTAFGNWLFTKTINTLHGGSYTDAMGGYRAYRTQLIYDLELDQDRWYTTPERLFRTRVSWEPLLSVRAARSKLRVAEIPGDEPARIGGERKLQVWKWGAAYYFQFWRDVFFHPR
jgi:glycosyltransferase involved in cell wall biosynthesis